MQHLLASAIGTALGVVLATATATVNPDVPGDVFVVETVDLALVRPAVEAWEREVPVHFVVRQGACEGVLPHRVCVHTVRHELFADALAENHWPDHWVGVTGFKPAIRDGSEVWVDLDAKDPAQIMLHELGHAQGLEHDDALPTAMYPFTNAMATRITCRDVAQWYRVRRRTMPVCGAPR